MGEGETAGATRRGRQLNVKLSESAWRGWQKWATTVWDGEEEHRSVSALMEVLGRSFDRGDLPRPGRLWDRLRVDAIEWSRHRYRRRRPVTNRLTNHDQVDLR